MKKQNKQGQSLHVFVAAGGKPKDYQGTKGLNSATVPNLKTNKK